MAELSGPNTMDDTLSLIEELSDTMSGDVTLAEAESWWSMVLRIEGSLDFDPQYSKHERELIERLKTSVSHDIRAVREGRKPNNSLARVALTGLQHSIERRTTGADGWPLRR